MASEQPDSFDSFLAVGSSLTVDIAVADERFVVDFGDESDLGILTEPDEHRLMNPTVRISSTREAIAAVLGGRSTLEESVLTGELDIVGELAEIALLHDALVAFMHGAVRCPSMPQVLARLRASTVH